MENPAPETKTDQPKTIVRAAEANEWGQITGLDPKAPYFVIRKPTPEFTRERSKEMVEQARAFLHEHRVLTEQQMKELNDKWGEPAKARVNEVRQVLEKRFDEISKEIEQRVAKLEGDLNDYGILRTRKQEGSPVAHGAGETPGEMPTGGNGGNASANASATDAKPKKKSSGKKDE